jgi:hypothetical protein
MWVQGKRVVIGYQVLVDRILCHRWLGGDSFGNFVLVREREWVIGS